MQFKQTVLSFFIFVLPVFVAAQSTLLPVNHKHQQFLERLEILAQQDSVFNFSATKPLNRKHVVLAAERLSAHGSLSKIDQYNLQNFLMNSPEWVSGTKTSFASKKKLLNTFYPTKANFVEVNEKDFFLAINPVLQQVQSAESGNNQRVFLNSKGIAFRGLIANKIGFNFYATDNQERTPLFVQSWEQKFTALPGAGFYKPFKTTAYDYFDARGSVHFNATKYINFQFGYDRNFIGNGYRSMFLSDFGNSYLFLKVNTRIWKINYQNLFMELAGRNKNNNTLLPKKYAAMHHLNLQATKWLNIGLFEGIVFGRQNKFDFTYLNPIILLRSAEQQNGSIDNAFLGFDAKANIAKTIQLYGQILFDEFLLKEIKAGNGWWGNKFALQGGIKYINAFKIKNLDLQAELNIVRPYTYAHFDSVSNYSHYNQPLAHPLGGNFSEFIGIIRYQATPKLYAQAKLIVFKQGLDTGTTNYGSNIFLLNQNRTGGDYGHTLASGVSGKGVNASLWLGYELWENFFIDGSFQYRKLNAAVNTLSQKTTLLSLGIRMHVNRREYDY
ncbi:MAG: hypothetical protein EAZ16_05230 [Sphingobacteriales bacterium]|nr:MAG: hypothetical protein EAZ16_05230 [Sphingobacteriales bacterium]